MVLGNAKWVLDLTYYVLDEVFDLADEFESVFSDQEAFAQKGEIIPFVTLYQDEIIANSILHQ
jgi:mediator of RNA polymerase II transcription subunit 16, fungi type